MNYMNAFSNTLFDSIGETEAVIRNQVYRVDFSSEASLNKLISDLKQNTGLEYKIFKETRGRKNFVLYRDDLYNVQDGYLHYKGNGNEQGGELEQPLNSSSLHGLFNNCKDIILLDLSKWQTSGIVDMSSMFERCDSLISLEPSNWDTSSVVDMSSMFAGCRVLDALGMDNWNTSNVEDMHEMFLDCTHIRFLPCEKWNINKVKDKSLMFYNCASLNNKPSWSEEHSFYCPDYLNEEERKSFTEEMERSLRSALW